MCPTRPSRLQQLNAIEMESVEKKFPVQTKMYKTNGDISILKSTWIEIQVIT